MINFELPNDPVRFNKLITKLYNALSTANANGHTFIKIDLENDEWVIDAKTKEELGDSKRNSMLEICSFINSIFVGAKGLGLADNRHMATKLINIRTEFDKLAEKYRGKVCCLFLKSTTNNAINRVMQSYDEIFSKARVVVRNESVAKKEMSVHEDSDTRTHLRLAYLVDNPPKPPQDLTQRSGKTNTSTLTPPTNPSNPTPSTPSHKSLNTS